MFLCSVYQSSLDGVAEYKEHVLHLSYSIDKYPYVQKERSRYRSQAIKYEQASEILAIILRKLITVRHNGGKQQYNLPNNTIQTDKCKDNVRGIKSICEDLSFYHKWKYLNFKKPNNCQWLKPDI